MPATPMKNLLYRAALPFLAPSVRGKLSVATAGHALTHQKSLVRVLEKHHVHGASVRLVQSGEFAQADVSVASGSKARTADQRSIYRVASITKTASALVMLRLIEQYGLSLDSEIAPLLPDGKGSARLSGMTLRHLLSHTSGLRDTPACDAALSRGDDFHAVLTSPGVVAARPGSTFAYCNFGFGLLGCVMESLTQLPLSAVMEGLLFRPLGMNATLDASTIPADDVMPITRVLSRHRQTDVRITALGRVPLEKPDPLRHFGHTAGAMYTDAPSLSRMLSLIAQEGLWDGRQLISPALIREMCAEQASYGAASPTLKYGLGLLLVDDPSVSPNRIIGHQGFAYGCVDGAFVETGTGRQVISLNGGASEARIGRMGLVNRDILRYALREELPAWK